MKICRLVSFSSFSIFNTLVLDSHKSIYGSVFVSDRYLTNAFRELVIFEMWEKSDCYSYSGIWALLPLACSSTNLFHESTNTAENSLVKTSQAFKYRFHGCNPWNIPLWWLFWHYVQSMRLSDNGRKQTSWLIQIRKYSWFVL